MSADRELLELAAKAAGIELKWMAVVNGPQAGEVFCSNWHPGTDDGDCARMEAALSIRVEWWRDSVTAYRQELGCANIQYSSHGGDRNAARRLASLQVAAEIGRAMP